MIYVFSVSFFFRKKQQTATVQVTLLTGVCNTILCKHVNGQNKRHVLAPTCALALSVLIGRVFWHLSEDLCIISVYSDLLFCYLKPFVYQIKFDVVHPDLIITQCASCTIFLAYLKFSQSIDKACRMHFDFILL